MEPVAGGPGPLLKVNTKTITFALTLAILVWIIYGNFLLPLNRFMNYEDLCPHHLSSEHYLLNLQPNENAFPLNTLKNDDYTDLIDLKNFSFDIVQKTKCLNSNVLLLVLVMSAAPNFKRRDTIRNTWGQYDSKVRLLFMLGAVTDKNIQTSIHTESRQYEDIIQGNFMDTYRNLTYKSVMALKYAVYHCSNAVYILKTDDDVFVNMPLMKNYLTNDISPFGATKLLQCIVFLSNEPFRNDSKWAVTMEEYPDSKYPIYCNGAWALFSPDVLFGIYREAQKIKYLFLEDVFLYGLAGQKIPGLVLEDIRNLTLSYKSPEDLSNGKFDSMNFLFGTLGMTDKELWEFWEYVRSRSVRSSVYNCSELIS